VEQFNLEHLKWEDYRGTRFYNKDCALVIKRWLNTGFKLKEVLPPTLEVVARGGMRTRGAGLRSLEGMGPKRFVLSVDDDTEFRSRCE
jgi:hypothetical protein